MRALRFRSVATGLAAAGLTGSCHAFVAPQSHSARPMIKAPAAALRAEPAAAAAESSDTEPFESGSDEPPSSSLSYTPHLAQAKAKIFEEEARALQQAATALEMQAMAWEEAAAALENQPMNFGDLLEMEVEAEEALEENGNDGSSDVNSEEGPDISDEVEDTMIEEEEIAAEESKPHPAAPPPRPPSNAPLRSRGIDIQGIGTFDVMEASVVPQSRADTEEEEWRRNQPTPYGIQNGGSNPFLKEEAKVEKEEKGEAVVEATVEHRQRTGGAWSASGTFQHGARRGSSLRELVSGAERGVSQAKLVRDGRGNKAVFREPRVATNDGRGRREARQQAMRNEVVAEAKARNARSDDAPNDNRGETAGQDEEAKVDASDDALDVQPKSTSLREILDQIG